ncbi:MAG: glutamate--tRNA ligase [Mangrovicoccus sp.]|nr:glutamate--tRNA ligase [Mangrovicoccus sp.]
MTTTRFAPSPTGQIHVGNLRTALFNFLITRKAGGTFILRIDDTDAERSKEEYVDGIRQDLEWLGLTWDRFERQSLRLDRYAEAADRLRAMGRLYECFETPTELDLKRKKLLNMGRPPVYDRAALDLTEAEKERLRAERGPGHWRFLLDRERIEWVDGINGPTSIDAASLSDPVLIRGDGQVLYTFASVVDDIDMGVTDIVRGADHVTNTATQTQIIKALGGTPPRFAHHSLLTSAGGEALSKRLGALSSRQLRGMGVEPMALLSLMARLGSSDPVELRSSMDELVEGFEIGHFGAAPTKFDEADLMPLTARHLAALPLEAVAADLAAAGVPADLAPAFWVVVRENIATRADISGWWEIVSAGAVPLVAPEDEAFVAEALALLPPLPFGPTTWSDWTGAVKAATGRKGKALFMPLRKALTGRERGPEMADFMALMLALPKPPAGA